MPQPPTYAQRFFRWFCAPELFEELQGDLEERFHHILREQGLKAARAYYRREVLFLLRPSVMRGFSFSLFPPNSLSMIRHYLTTAQRTLRKHPLHTSINLAGLTLGLTGCLLIALFVHNEFSYDRFHPEVARTYRVYNERMDETERAYYPIVPPTFGPTLEAEFPEVEESLRLMDVYGKSLFTQGDRSFLERRGVYAEPSMLSFFRLPLLEGSPEQALRNPNEVLITEELAHKYFDRVDVVGEELEISGRTTTVVGVLQNLPENMHLQVDYILSFETVLKLVPEERMNSWLWQQFFTYIRLHPEADPEAFAAKLPAWALEHGREVTEPLGFTYRPHLQAVTDVYLHSSSFRWEMAQRGNITYVYALILVGIFLLVIAVINFVNLTTARAEKRAREVGIRKVSGAHRFQLIVQFGMEALLMALTATLLATALGYALVPGLNQLAGKSLTLSSLCAPAPLLAWLGVGLLTGLLAGAYPALVLSGFQPVRVLKGGTIRLPGKGQTLRKGLVVLQFSLSILLIIGTTIIYQQLSFLQNKSLGFNKEQVLTFPARGDMAARFAQTRQRFLDIPDVKAVTIGYGFPGELVAKDQVMVPERNDASYSTNLFCIDHAYVETLQLRFVAGRDLDPSFSTDANEAFLINEAAVQQFGFGSPEEALGKRLNWNMWGMDSVKRGTVVGVVEDFHVKSLHEKVEASVLHIFPPAYQRIGIRLETTHLAQSLQHIEQAWNSFETGYPLDYQFVDERFGNMYQTEKNLAKSLGLFTLLTIFVSCIGLLGLVSFAAQQRTREIGIRKVMGASTSSILRLLTLDFLKLILLAMLIASPLAWYLARGWLQQFPYRVDIHWWVFVLAGLGAMFIALVTISLQSLRAASRNPVDSLRHE